MFESLYHAYVHMPWVGWISGTVLLVILMRKLPYFYGFMLLCVVFMFLDSLRSGAWLNAGSAGHMLAEPFIYLFVLFGDLRYFLLMYRYGKHHDLDEAQGGPTSMWARVIAWTLAPTLALRVAATIIPEAFVEPRHIFLVYELIMFCMALVFLNGLLPSWVADRETRQWLRRVTGVELAHYGLWILSDVLILSGVDAGFGLRFVPDVIYYACFIPAVYLLAPSRLKMANFRST